VSHYALFFSRTFPSTFFGLSTHLRAIVWHFALPFCALTIPVQNPRQTSCIRQFYGNGSAAQARAPATQCAASFPHTGFTLYAEFLQETAARHSVLPSLLCKLAG
jgi:hypothetical protein